MNHRKLNELSAAICRAGIDVLARCQEIADTPSLRRLWHDESGQDLIEYALVAALVGLGAVTALKALKTSISTAFTSVGSTLTSSV